MYIYMIRGRNQKIHKGSEIVLILHEKIVRKVNISKNFGNFNDKRRTNC